MAEATQDRIVALVAVDGSRYSEHALQWYTKTLYRPEFELLLVHCVEPLSSISESTSPEEYEQMLDGGRQAAKKVEEKFTQYMVDNKISGKTETIFGHRPGEVLVDVAKRSKAAMIVVGSRGLSQVRKTMLGSVSDYLVHHADCPVIVCRDTMVDNKLNIM